MTSTFSHSPSGARPGVQVFFRSQTSPPKPSASFAYRKVDERVHDVEKRIMARQCEVDRAREKLNELEFDMFMLLLTVAGNETTRNATASGMDALLRNPDQMARLVANLDDDAYLSGAIDEVLRWATPVLQFRRTATVDTEIRGQKIAAGDKVLIWHISANRDEEIFPESQTFDVGRTPNEHIAFGGRGPHYCLGASLAKMEIRVMFEEMLTRIPNITQAGEIERLHSNLINGVKHLPVRNG
jgi:cholest-4-en-3-one 26-monooxygenase